MAKVEEVPVQPSLIKHSAEVELEHLIRLMGNLSPEDWGRPSAVEGWTIGAVVAHLDLFAGMYGRFLGAVLAGRGSSGLARTIGWLTSSVLPAASPVFDTINAVIPRLMSRVSTSERLKTQFVVGARKARARVSEVGPDDYNRPVHFEGGPYPLSFYLGVLVNELAVHAWDIESEIQEVAGLSADARRVLPWFYWSSSKLMLRLPTGSSGTVQVMLSEPASTMWWSLGNRSIDVGRGMTSHADTQIFGSSGAFVLALAGRIRRADARRSLLGVDGDRALAETFLASWHLI